MDAKFIINLSGNAYPTYQGVLAEAHERGLQAIETELLQIPTADNEHTAIVKATIRMKDGSTFEEFGDASPRNVNARIAAALIRMASTRAKGRALRDACNIGQTMLEELGDEEAAGKVAGTAGSARPSAERRTPSAEETFRANGRVFTRKELTVALMRHLERARELGLPTDAIDAETDALGELWEHGRHLAAMIRAAEEEAAQRKKEPHT